MRGGRVIRKDGLEGQREVEPLQEGKERYRSFFDTAGEAFCITDSGGGIVEANAAALSLLGYSRDEMAVMNIREACVWPIGYQRFARQLENKGYAKDCRVKLLKKDGVETDALLNVTVRRASGGGIEHHQYVIREMTECECEMEALRESERRYRLMTDNVTDVIWIMDTNLQLTYISPSVERLRGCTVDEVMTQKLEEIFTPASLEVVLKLIEEELPKRSPERSGLVKLGTMGLEMLRKDGSTVWTETRVTMLYDPDGLVAELMGVTRDVAERKKADEELRKSEEKYRSLVENINAVIYAADVKGTITYLSPVVESFYGHSPVEFGGQHFSSIAHKEDLPLAMDSFQQTLSGKNEVLEFRVVLPWSGEVRWSRTYNRPMYDGDRVVGVQGVLIDVTDRKRMEEALRDSERRYRLLAENVTDVIWVTDLNWSRTYISPSGQRLTGRSIDEAIDHTVQETLTPASRERAMKVFAGQLAIEKKRKKDLHRSWTLQLEVVRKDGSTVWTEDRVTFLRDADGRPTGVLGVTRDITERKQAEDMLRALSRRLVEVQETERRQIARELHDEVGQALTGLKLLLETVTRLQGRNLISSLSEAQVLINELIGRVQDMSLDLRPAILDDLGLAPALLWHLERYKAQTGVNVIFEHRGLQRRFAPEIETAVYRIVQEGLTNVARHAAVGEAMVRLVAGRGVLSVQIEDHGAGFDSERALANGTSSGLNGMRERAALLGGQFRINSTLGAGTRLVARFPIGLGRTKS
ncbi:MAG: hypothetical protein A2Y72_00170 [Chloroflexi bacterium RBG_13_53_26]|nr:MAG: hypothetical protein A2Y72_00170 [Chloroflexi bacterium RBG_13_53_26]